MGNTLAWPVPPQEVAMPWRGSSHMDEKIRFIHTHCAGVFNFTELRAFLDVSRNAGYK